MAVCGASAECEEVNGKDPLYPQMHETPIGEVTMIAPGMTIELEIASRILAAFASDQAHTTTEWLFQDGAGIALSLARKLIAESEK